MATRRRQIVIVLGAGFSAGLGFPLTSELLPLALGRIVGDARKLVTAVIRFHFPIFKVQDVSTYPNIEMLLTKIAVNEDLWSASRPTAGGFKRSDLVDVREELLHWIAVLLHKRLEDIPNTPWLNAFVHFVRERRATIISFNWDLVLEKFLFDGQVTHASYGLDDSTSNAPILLKPHGSLNWYEDKAVEPVRDDRLSSLTADLSLPPEYSEIMLFERLRSPMSSVGRRYIPYVMPPTFLKRFDHPLLRKVWLTAVQRIGRAGKVTFIGYSFPAYDYHADFLFRCGFDNQRQGVPTRHKDRLPATGSSDIVVVNPDEDGALKARMSSLFGFGKGKTKNQVKYVYRKAAAWIKAGGLQDELDN